ncbi:MAG: tripartite tricarboxylate transporter TctB family protein [Chloroflexi bacterium]|nr:tripartite tricarboxylate transporter TctB family protein [Chloroflexota bacterium]
MPARRWQRADLAITVGFLVLFVLALVQARAWPFRTSLFPTIISSFVIAILVLKLVLDLSAAARRAPAAVAPTVGGLVEEEEAAAAKLEDVFETAPRAVWLSALVWMAAFFVLLWAVGILITLPLFAFVYLLRVSRESVPLAAGYAAGAWLFIYALFDQALHVPLPTGALLGALGL